MIELFTHKSEWKKIFKIIQLFYVNLTYVYICVYFSYIIIYMYIFQFIGNFLLNIHKLIRRKLLSHFTICSFVFLEQPSHFH